MCCHAMPENWPLAPKVLRPSCNWWSLRLLAQAFRSELGHYTSVFSLKKMGLWPHSRSKTFPARGHSRSYSVYSCMCLHSTEHRLLLGLSSPLSSSSSPQPLPHTHSCKALGREGRSAPPLCTVNNNNKETGALGLQWLSKHGENACLTSRISKFYIS